MAKPSLVAQAAAQNQTALAESAPNLPAVPKSVEAGSMQVGEPVSVGSPYVSFLHSRAAHYQKVLIAVPGVQEGDPVLILPEPKNPVKLAPFRFFLMSAKHYWGVVSDAGLLLETSLTSNRERVELKEHIDTVLLVFLPGGSLIPATCTFKTTKVNAAHKVVQAVKLAATDEWGKISKEHAATLAASEPWLRVVSTITTQPYIGKASGRKSFIANAAPAPSQAADWIEIQKFFSDKANSELLAIVGEQFQRRMAEVKAKLRG